MKLIFVQNNWQGAYEKIQYYNGTKRNTDKWNKHNHDRSPFYRMCDDGD